MRAYIVSIIAMVAYMFHFWWGNRVVWGVLWGIAACCAIWCIYDGVVAGILIDNKKEKALATSGAVVGILIFLGLTLGAIFVFPGRFLAK